MHATDVCTCIGCACLCQTIYEDATQARKADFPFGPERYRSLCYQRLEEEQSFLRTSLNENTVSEKEPVLC
jgi:hypothetical protein